MAPVEFTVLQRHADPRHVPVSDSGFCDQGINRRASIDPKSPVNVSAIRWSQGAPYENADHHGPVEVDGIPQYSILKLLHSPPLLALVSVWKLAAHIGMKTYDW